VEMKAGSTLLISDNAPFSESAPRCDINRIDRPGRSFQRVAPLHETMSSRALNFRSCPNKNNLYKFIFFYIIFSGTIINPFHINGVFRFLFIKISRNFKRSPTYILSFSKIKYKHLIYKLEGIFMNFYRFF